MAMELTTKNKIGFVNGTIPCAAQIAILFNAWNHCNNIVIAWILNFVSKDIANSLMYIAIPTKIWIDLCNHFRHNNALQVFQLKKNLIALKQGALDINTY